MYVLVGWTTRVLVDSFLLWTMNRVHLKIILSNNSRRASCYGNIRLSYNIFKKISATTVDVRVVTETYHYVITCKKRVVFWSSCPYCYQGCEYGDRNDCSNIIASQCYGSTIRTISCCKTCYDYAQNYAHLPAGTITFWKIGVEEKWHMIMVSMH